MIRAVYISVILAFALDAAAQFEVERIGTLDARIAESSGLVASRRYPGVLWTHNDGGLQMLFAVAPSGHRIGAFGVPGNLVDWEDIAIDNAGGLYLADIGSNGIVRTHVAIHRVSEPDPYKRFGNTKITRSWLLRFPEGRQQDCEAFFVHGGFGYLINKRSAIGAVSMYRFSLADRRRSIPLQLVARLAMESPITAADLSVDGKRLALTSSDGVYLYFLPGAPPSAASVTPMYFDFRDDFMEGGTFFGNGFLTSSEKRYLWFFKDLSFQCRAPARLEDPLPNFTVPTGTPVRFEAEAIGCPPPQFVWLFNGQPIPDATNSFLTLPSVSPADAGAYQVAVFNRFGGETNMALLNVLLRADIRITEVMSSPSADASVETADWWEITNFEARQMDLSGWRFNDSGGGLTDPFVLPDGLMLDPGETIILVENLSPDEFRVWWGANNIPPNVRIITYEGSGLSFRATGDTIYVWDNIATDPEDYVTRADFSEADPGVTFIYNPDTNLFGDKSQLGIHGAVKAERGSDIGSPGKLVGF